MQVLDFLIESVQGPCIENQITLCRVKIVDICKDFLAKFKLVGNYSRLGIFNDYQKNRLNILFKKSIKLLVSLLEGTINSEIIESLNELDFVFLFELLSKEYENSLKKKFISKIGFYFNEEQMECFNIFILLKTLSDINPVVGELLNSQENYSHYLAIKFYEKNTGSIEILFKGKLLKIYFPIQPICK